MAREIPRTISYAVGTMERGITMGSGANTIQDAAYGAEREIQRMARFGSSLELIEAEWVCTECSGQGTVNVRTSRLYTTKVCPVCRGKDVRIDCLSAIQRLRCSYDFRAARAQISAELDEADEDSRKFTAAYRYAEAEGMTDSQCHEWACYHKSDPQFSAVA